MVNNYNLFLKNKKSNILYACVYHNDDAGVKLIFSNVYDDEIIEFFKTNDLNLINTHIKRYGCEIESHINDSINVLRVFDLDENWDLFFS